MTTGSKSRKNKKRKRDETSSSENSPLTKKHKENPLRKKRRYRSRRYRSGGARIIKNYLQPLFNKYPHTNQTFIKKHDVTTTNLNNINIILKKIRDKPNKNYTYLIRNLSEGKKPPAWRPANLKHANKKAPTRAQQLIYIAIDFLQKTNETVKNYMEKQRQHVRELAYKRTQKFANTHYPDRKRYKLNSGRKKVKKKIKTTSINPYARVEKQSFFTKPTQKNPALPNSSKFKSYQPPKETKPVNNFNTFTFLSPEEKRFLNEDLSDPYKETTFGNNLFDLTLDF